MGGRGESEARGNESEAESCELPTLLWHLHDKLCIKVSHVNLSKYALEMDTGSR